MPSFQDMKKLWALQKKAKEMQKELKATEVEAKSADGKISVVLDGEMKIKSIAIDPSLLSPDKKSVLESTLTSVISEALSKTQTLSAQKAREMMGDMGINIPGM